MRTKRLWLTPTLVLAIIGLCERPAEASGTHLLLQLQAGLATPPLGHLDLAVGYGVEVGYGGTLGGTPVRFYGIAAFDRADFSSSFRISSFRMLTLIGSKPLKGSSKIRSLGS